MSFTKLKKVLEGKNENYLSFDVHNRIYNSYLSFN